MAEEVFSIHDQNLFAFHPLGRKLEAGRVIAKRSKKNLLQAPFFATKVESYFLVKVSNDQSTICHWRFAIGDEPRGDVSVEFSASGRFVSFCNFLGYRIFDTGEEKLNLEPIELDKDKNLLGLSKGLCWHPTKDWFATVKSRGDCMLAIVNALTQEILYEQALDFQSGITSIAWSPNGRFLAISGKDQSILLRDFEILSDTRLLGHKSEITGLYFSPDSQRLLSVAQEKGDSEDNVKIWGTQSSPEALASKNLNMVFVQGSPWSPDGRRFVGQTWDEKLQVFELASR